MLPADLLAERLLLLSVGRFRAVNRVVHAGCRVKLEDRLAAVASARESSDGAAVAREIDCERQLDHLDSALQVWRPDHLPSTFLAILGAGLCMQLLQYSLMDYSGSSQTNLPMSCTTLTSPDVHAATLYGGDMSARDAPWYMRVLGTCR